MRKQKYIVLSTRFFWFSIFIILILATGCIDQNEPTPSTDISSVPAPQLSDLDVASGQTIYVPAYSKMYNRLDRTLDLAVTLNIHNTDFEHPIILTSVRYYDTQGELLKEYIEEPQLLGPLASTDFFVVANEQSGGLGTNFIVEWVAEQPVFEPIVETVMLNTSNNQGISLTSPGRVINQIAPQDN